MIRRSLSYSQMSPRASRNRCSTRDLATRTPTGRHSQVGGNVGGSAALDGGCPERPPGAIVELRADHFADTDEATAARRHHRFLVDRLGVGELGEPELGLGSAFPTGLPSEPAEMVVNLVPKDDPQPAAKGVAGPLFLEPTQVSGHGQESVLKHIGRVRLVQAPTAAPAVGERRIQIHERRPRGWVVRPGPVDQASGSAGRRRVVGHGDGTGDASQAGPTGAVCGMLVARSRTLWVGGRSR